MDNLRWILLAIGIVIIVAVYIWGRSRKKNKPSSPLDAANDVPSFAAYDADDGWKDGVGPVRIVNANSDEENPRGFESDISDEQSDQYSNTDQPLPEDEPDDSIVSEHQEELALDTTENASETTVPVSVDDVVALYLVSQHGQELKGEQILSATYATHLEYGDMKIFHRMDANGKVVFSLSNMLEPGWFDFDKMHEMKTRGIGLFIQLRLCDDPVKALDDMLLCAHSLSNMLGAQLCDQNRHLLTESYTKGLREKAKHIAKEKQA